MPDKQDNKPLPGVFDLTPLKAHCTLIIVEHDLHFIRDICDHLTVLDQGRVLDHGDVETIQRSPKVQQVFTTRV